MGVLYARVAGAWVPVVNGAVPPVGQTWNADPAYGGPRRDGYPTHAQFGHKNRSWLEGFCVAPDGSAFAATAPDQGFTIYNSTGANQLIMSAQFTPSFAQIKPFVFYDGDPAAGIPGIRVGGNTILLAAADGSAGFICGSDSARLRPGGVDKLVAYANGITYSYNHLTMENAKIWVTYNPNLGWDQAHVVAYSSDTSTRQAHIAISSPGVAPQLRAVGTSGERIGVVNGQITAHAPIAASAFETNSTIVDKREVRSLREREHIVLVTHDVRVDEVPLPDIMSLRPVAFRPKLLPQWITPTNGDYSTVVPTDPTTWHYEQTDGILGHEGTRERLGLIAEEVETIIPSAVSHDMDGDAMGIDYAQITVALLDHVQELTRTIETLQYRIAELERVA